MVNHNSLASIKSFWFFLKGELKEDLNEGNKFQTEEVLSSDPPVSFAASELYLIKILVLVAECWLRVDKKKKVSVVLCITQLNVVLTCSVNFKSNFSAISSLMFIKTGRHCFIFILHFLFTVLPSKVKTTLNDLGPVRVFAFLGCMLMDV